MVPRHPGTRGRTWRRRRESVLLVDDNPELLELYAALLRRHGFRVSAATGANQGLRVLKKARRFDHIVSDFRMPGMNGIDFLRRTILLRPGSARTLLTAALPPARRLREAKHLGVRVILKTAALDCLLGRGPHRPHSRP